MVVGLWGLPDETGPISSSLLILHWYSAINITYYIATAPIDHVPNSCSGQWNPSLSVWTLAQVPLLVYAAAQVKWLIQQTWCSVLPKITIDLGGIFTAMYRGERAIGNDLGEKEAASCPLLPHPLVSAFMNHKKTTLAVTLDGHLSST